MKRPGSFSARLNQAMSRGDFTIADLAIWFDRPYHTVWFWVSKGRSPRGSVGLYKLMHRRLELLEGAVTRKRGLPIPLSLTQFERPGYVGKLRHDIETARVSQGRSAC